MSSTPDPVGTLDVALNHAVKLLEESPALADEIERREAVTVDGAAAAAKMLQQQIKIQVGSTCRIDVVEPSVEETAEMDRGLDGGAGESEAKGPRLFPE